MTADLPTVLHGFIESRRSAPFVWGRHDCCLFVADWIKEIHGIDLAEELGVRGKYHSPLAAWREVKARGGVETIADGALSKHGWQSVTVAYARRGDIVATPTPRHGAALGICLGAVAAFAGPCGLVFLPTPKAARAWRIG